MERHSAMQHMRIFGLEKCSDRYFLALLQTPQQKRELRLVLEKLPLSRTKPSRGGRSRFLP